MRQLLVVAIFYLQSVYAQVQFIPPSDSSQDMRLALALNAHTTEIVERADGLRVLQYSPAPEALEALLTIGKNPSLLLGDRVLDNVIDQATAAYQAESDQLDFSRVTQTSAEFLLAIVQVIHKDPVLRKKWSQKVNELWPHRRQELEALFELHHIPLQLSGDFDFLVQEMVFADFNRLIAKLLVEPQSLASNLNLIEALNQAADIVAKDHSHFAGNFGRQLRQAVVDSGIGIGKLFRMQHAMGLDRALGWGLRQDLHADTVLRRSFLKGEGIGSIAFYLNPEKLVRILDDLAGLEDFSKWSWPDLESASRHLRLIASTKSLSLAEIKLNQKISRAIIQSISETFLLPILNDKNKRVIDFVDLVETTSYFANAPIEAKRLLARAAFALIHDPIEALYWHRVFVGNVLRPSVLWGPQDGVKILREFLESSGAELSRSSVRMLRLGLKTYDQWTIWSPITALWKKCTRR